MDIFIPYNKLSKKKKRELDLQRRRTWGPLNPVTRNTENPKAYNRAKARKWKSDDYPTVPFLFLSVSFLHGFNQPTGEGCPGRSAIVPTRLATALKTLSA